MSFHVVGGNSRRLSFKILVAFELYSFKFHAKTIVAQLSDTSGKNILSLWRRSTNFLSNFILLYWILKMYSIHYLPDWALIKASKPPTSEIFSTFLLPEFSSPKLGISVAILTCGCWVEVPASILSVKALSAFLLLSNKRFQLILQPLLLIIQISISYWLIISRLS